MLFKEKKKVTGRKRVYAGEKCFRKKYSFRKQQQPEAIRN